MFKNHYHEKMPADLVKMFHKRNVHLLKMDLYSSFEKSKLLGICEDDCSVIPRILPYSYLPIINATCYSITEFLMKLLSLPTNELKALIPKTPIVNYLINELDVLKHRKKRITGSLRYDMAIVGEPHPLNPPKLFEINEIGFDGTGRSSYIQETFYNIFPQMRKRLYCLDTGLNEVKNMRRLGAKMVRMQYNNYNWEEEVIIAKAKKIGLDIKMISPNAFNVEVERGCENLKYANVCLGEGKIKIGKIIPDLFQISYSFELSDYKEEPNFFRKLIRTKTPQYSPFITGLIAPKTTLVLLDDEDLRRRLIGEKKSKMLGNAILPAKILKDNEEEIKRNAKRLVLKHADGMGGEQVFVGEKILGKLKKIKQRNKKYWVAQKRVNLNTIDVDGILSRKRRVVADLGVFIQYDWNGEKFTNFSVGGFITRATNRSYKVNVSGGGIQVPVFFDKLK